MQKKENKGKENRLPRAVDNENLVMALKEECDHWVAKELEEMNDFQL